MMSGPSEVRALMSKVRLAVMVSRHSNSFLRFMIERYRGKHTGDYIRQL